MCLITASTESGALLTQQACPIPLTKIYRRAAALINPWTFFPKWRMKTWLTFFTVVPENKQHATSALLRHFSEQKKPVRITQSQTRLRNCEFRLHAWKQRIEWSMLLKIIIAIWNWGHGWRDNVLLSSRPPPPNPHPSTLLTLFLWSQQFQRGDSRLSKVGFPNGLSSKSITISWWEHFSIMTAQSHSGGHG